MRRLHLTILLAAIFSFTIETMAQTGGSAGVVRVKPKVESFTTTVNGTARQGEPFTVVYTLSANSWKGGHRPRQGKGFQIRDVDYVTIRSKPFMQLNTKVTYVTSLSGEQELPGMSIQVGDSIYTSERKTVNIVPNADYGEEMMTAHQWLLKEGKNPDSLCLTMDNADKDFLLFADKRNQAFCIIGRKQIWPLIGQPVMAYGTDNAISINGTDRNYNSIILHFRQQIEALKNTPKNFVSSARKAYEPKHHAVEPMLRNRRWGQLGPYNMMSPTYDNKKTLVGCVPLALALVLDYHRWPETGQSNVYYQTNSDKVYNVDYTTFKPQWETFKDSYNNRDSTADIANLSKTLVMLGLAIDATFREGSTSANLGNVKPVLCNNLGYSGRATFYERGCSEEDIAAVIYRNLDNHQPCLVSNDGHVFVCDGYKDDFLHYNLGWFGNFNGYYRVKLGNYDKPANKNLLLVKYLVADIIPQKGEIKREVTLQKAGTLAQLLTAEEQRSITQLTISGPLNSADIRLLRRMAGAFDEEASAADWDGGSLKHLNLKEATIVNDKEPYLTERATGVWTHWETDNSGKSKTVKYSFATMTEKEWKGFKRDIGDKQEGRFYTRSNDNSYWTHYTSQKNVIGENMFARCSSLHSIILPQSTTEIGDYAFMRCISLKKITIPQKTETLGKKAFLNCTSLEKVLAPAKMQTKGVACDKCSPILRSITRY